MTAADGVRRAARRPGPPGGAWSPSWRRARAGWRSRWSGSSPCTSTPADDADPDDDLAWFATQEIPDLI